LGVGYAPPGLTFAGPTGRFAGLLGVPSYYPTTLAVTHNQMPIAYYTQTILYVKYILYMLGY